MRAYFENLQINDEKYVVKKISESNLVTVSLHNWLQSGEQRRDWIFRRTLHSALEPGIRIIIKNRNKKKPELLRELYNTIITLYLIDAILQIVNTNQPDGKGGSNSRNSSLGPKNSPKKWIFNGPFSNFFIKVNMNTFNQNSNTFYCDLVHRLAVDPQLV